MNKPSIVRRSLKWTLIALFSLPVVMILVLAGTTALVNSGHLHTPILRYLVARTGREIRVSGPIRMRLLSLHPALTATEVVIGNPPWMPAGHTAEIARLSVDFDLSLFPPSWSIRRLELDTAKLHLLRDEKGLSNWRARPLRSGNGPPLIHSLSIRGAEVDLHDARRHLDFEGYITAQDGPLAEGSRALSVEGSGQLNARAVTFALAGDPLATASSGKPYQFRFAAQSSGSLLTGRGSLSRPFDFRVLTTTFEATGKDMRDLYYLTGLALPDTGVYRILGKVERRDLRFSFADLTATTGRSDMRGTVEVDSTGKRPQIDARLHSGLLRLADLGKKAAGRALPKPKDQHVLSDTPLRLAALRRNDAQIRIDVDHFDAGRLQLKGSAAVKSDHGKMFMEPLVSFADGTLGGQLTFDASNIVPRTEMDLHFTGLQLAQFHKGSSAAPLEGLLRGRITARGEGISVHRIAASASGRISIVLPQGTIRASLAELAGADLRGKRLARNDSDKTTGVRCAVASLNLDHGIASTHSVVLDTNPMLITGSGTIDLDKEEIRLTFNGRPKHMRLRLRSPLIMSGWLGSPSINVKAGKVAAQGGMAVALGVLLTPLAAVLAFVDPGLASDADCAALLADAGAFR